MKAPGFWQDGGGPWPLLLAPVSSLFDLAGKLRRLTATPWQAPVPIICVGNLTAGGTGKTPIVVAIARRLSGSGRTVHLLTRGYGGRLTGPIRVDPATHTAADVGDEALLLARAAPAWVARDRRAGARAAITAGADIIVMDDGFQNPSLIKDFSLVVVDGTEGFGNGRVMPAGPLRESVASGLSRADAAAIVGTDTSDTGARIRAVLPTLPVLACRLAPPANDLRGTRVFGFAGIGRPAKFEDTLREIGCEVAGFRAYPDHHPYTEHEVASLLAEAERLGAMPVTTAKDAVRLPGDARAKVRVVEIEAVFSDADGLDALLAKATRPALTP